MLFYAIGLLAMLIVPKASTCYLQPQKFLLDLYLYLTNLMPSFEFPLLSEGTLM